MQYHISKQVLSEDINKIQYKKSLGQHFFVNKSFLEQLVNLTKINKNDIVLEVGTGTGTLTKILVKRAGFVVSVEIEKRLFERVKKELNSNKQLILINSNIFNDKKDKRLNSDIEELFIKNVELYNLTPKIISNPPYNISSPLLEAIISSRVPFKDIYLILQKEVAERIVAKIGSKEYSSLSVFIQSFCESKILKYISKRNFFPVPEVDGAFIRIKPRDTFDNKFRDYSLFLKKIFSFRRKNIKNIFSMVFNEQISKVIIEKFQLSNNLRCENLPAPIFKQIYENYYFNFKDKI
ncbi:MAG: 16S rRNA (adenine(1518)-N(6)/adenine(1519)-N(6))-dimethyltransferase RsmA [Planctomycetota bacterium]